MPFQENQAAQLTPIIPTIQAWGERLTSGQKLRTSLGDTERPHLKKMPLRELWNPGRGL